MPDQRLGRDDMPGHMPHTFHRAITGNSHGRTQRPGGLHTLEFRLLRTP